MRSLLYFVFLYNAVTLTPAYGQGKRMFRGLEASSVVSQSYGDTVITFHVKPADEDMQHAEDRRYYWFHQGYIKSTVGYHTGKLLHGKTERFNRKGNLLEAGQFQDGLKTGVWRSWFDNGNQATNYHWRYGVLTGPFIFYYNTGVVQQRGRYKAGKLHGLVSIYNEQGKLQLKERFVKGNLVVKPSRAENKEQARTGRKTGGKVQSTEQEVNTPASKTSSKRWYQFWRKKSGDQDAGQKPERKSSRTSKGKVSDREESKPTAKPSKKKKGTTRLPE